MPVIVYTGEIGFCFGSTAHHFQIRAKSELLVVMVVIIYFAYFFNLILHAPLVVLHIYVSGILEISAPSLRKRKENIVKTNSFDCMSPLL